MLRLTACMLLFLNRFEHCLCHITQSVLLTRIHSTTIFNLQITDCVLLCHMSGKCSTLSFGKRRCILRRFVNTEYVIPHSQSIKLAYIKLPSFLRKQLTAFSLESVVKVNRITLVAMSCINDHWIILRWGSNNCIIIRYLHGIPFLVAYTFSVRRNNMFLELGVSVKTSTNLSKSTTVLFYSRLTRDSHLENFGQCATTYFYLRSL